VCEVLSFFFFYISFRQNTYCTVLFQWPLEVLRADISCCCEDEMLLHLSKMAGEVVFLFLLYLIPQNTYCFVLFRWPLDNRSTCRTTNTWCSLTLSLCPQCTRARLPSQGYLIGTTNTYSRTDSDSLVINCV